MLVEAKPAAEEEEAEEGEVKQQQAKREERKPRKIVETADIVTRVRARAAEMRFLTPRQNRRLFGSLLGHLKKAKSTLEVESKTALVSGSAASPRPARCAEGMRSQAQRKRDLEEKVVHRIDEVREEVKSERRSVACTAASGVRAC